MAEALIDTDVFVDHLRGARDLSSHQGSCYSIITRCELFAGRNAEERFLNELLAGFRELPLTRDIAEAAGRLRRTSGIPTPDALIAATALSHDLPVLTRNARHFALVPGLTIAKPQQDE